MFARIFYSAAIAGLIAGLVWSVLQQVWAVPLILEAETYESAAAATGAAELSAGEGAGNEHHEHDGAWHPNDGAERVFFTVIGNMVLATGLGLLLAVCFALRGNVGWREGLLWGLAGFMSMNLAPALGLPPELPGTEGAPLAFRQIWWLATVAATSIGLSMLAFSSKRALKALGVLLVALPHLVGEPHPQTSGGLAPVELEHAFIVATLVTSGVMWLVLGGLTAGLFTWLSRSGDSRLSSPTI